MKTAAILSGVAIYVFFLVSSINAQPVGQPPNQDITLNNTTATNSTDSSSAAGNTTTSNNKVLVGYFPNYLYDTFLPSQINFTAYTHIYYAFAVEVAGNTPIWEDPSIFDANATYSFQTLLQLAKAANTKVVVSIGGWTGSTNFSTMAANATGRAEFIQWNIDFINMYGTDGVDIDWEYPNNTGPGCNTFSPDDVNNLLTLVKELRAALDVNFKDNYKEITLAVYLLPTWSPDSSIMMSASGFVPYVDRFQVMTYEINTAPDPISGPNASFRAQPGYGFPYGYVEGINAWHDAGVPYNKIAGGIPFYGKSRTLNITYIPATQYNPAFPNPPLGDANDGPFTNPYCPSDTSAASGDWAYKNLRSQGILTSPTTAAEPWIRNFDNYTQTPWLFNPTNNTYISYDDVISVSVKTQWAIENNLAGLFCWSVDQDNGELLAAMEPILSNNKISK